MKKLILFFGICIFANFKTNAQTATIYNDTPYPITVYIYDLSDCSYSLLQVTANSGNTCNTMTVPPYLSYTPGSVFSCSSTAPDYGFSVSVNFSGGGIQSDYMMNNGNSYFQSSCYYSPLSSYTVILPNNTFGNPLINIWEVNIAGTDEIHVSY